MALVLLVVCVLHGSRPLGFHWRSVRPSPDAAGASRWPRWCCTACGPELEQGPFGLTGERSGAPTAASAHDDARCQVVHGSRPRACGFWPQWIRRVHGRHLLRPGRWVVWCWLLLPDDRAMLPAHIFFALFIIKGVATENNSDSYVSFLCFRQLSNVLLTIQLCVTSHTMDSTSLTCASYYQLGCSQSQNYITISSKTIMLTMK
jgi:hypothetical protein